MKYTYFADDLSEWKTSKKTILKIFLWGFEIGLQKFVNHGT